MAKYGTSYTWPLPGEISRFTQSRSLGEVKFMFISLMGWCALHICSWQPHLNRVGKQRLHHILEGVAPCHKALFRSQCFARAFKVLIRLSRGPAACVWDGGWYKPQSPRQDPTSTLCGYRKPRLGWSDAVWLTCSWNKSSANPQTVVLAEAQGTRKAQPCPGYVKCWFCYDSKCPMEKTFHVS